jgi:YggT family protein
MIGIVGFIIKSYIVVLLLRNSMSRQELYFNPAGKMVASFTEPIFSTLFKSVPKEKADKYIPFIIVILAIIYGLLISVLTPIKNLPNAMFNSFHEILVFLMLFYIVCVILGSFVNTYGASIYTTFFHRMGLPWVKTARGIINIPGNKIVVFAIILIFVAYLIIDTLFLVGYSFMFGQFNILASLLVSLKFGLLSVTSLIGYLKWLIIIRVLMTWVSPDPSNPIVQIIASLTDPIMEPFRKIIPPLGMIDLSPIILIFLLEFLRIFLINFIGKII